jgi:hypothetical protein
MSEATRGRYQVSISQILAKALTNYDSQKSIGSKLRAKRIEPLLNMIEALSKKYSSVNIIDIGGTEKYWDIVGQNYLDKHNVTITIVNLPQTVKPNDHRSFKFVEADGCDLSQFSDKSFHVGHSNSVIEHVGDWDHMVRFAKEISRVSQNYYVQTPNYWFPVEPHCMTPFYHWLPKPIRVWLVIHFELGYWRRATSIDQAVRTVEGARLLNKKMFRELFKDSEIITERLAWLPKSFVAIKNSSVITSLPDHRTKLPAADR